MKKLSIILSIFILTSISLVAQTVYVTNTGAKYHSSGCRYLSRSQIAISLSQALSQGYDACSICNPPTKVIKKHSSKKKHTKKHHTTNRPLTMRCS